MSVFFPLSLIIAEIKRFRHNGLWFSLLIPLGVGILVQIAVPDSLASELSFEKRAFYCIIFSYWMGVTNASRRIVGDRRVIYRLRLGGASSISIFASKLAVVVVAALIHSVSFYTVFAFNIADLEPTSRINGNINAWIYGQDQLVLWKDRGSKWHEINEDPFSDSRDPYYHEKLQLGDWYEQSRSDQFRWFKASDGAEHPFNPMVRFSGLLYALFLASASAGVMGLALSAAFKEGQTDRVLLCVPFVTAFQIMYAKVTTGGSAALFGPLESIPAVYEWFSMYHLLSFLSFSRYLITISNYRDWHLALTSLDAIAIYLFMTLFAIGTLILLKRRDTP